MLNSPSIPRIWLASAVHHQDRLLLLARDRHEVHARSSHRFANRLRIVGVVLPSSAIRDHELCRDQPHRVSELRQFSRPIMGAGASFHTNQARRKLGKVGQHLIAREGFGDHDSSLLVYTVYLNDPFRKIDAASEDFRRTAPDRGC